MACSTGLKSITCDEETVLLSDTPPLRRGYQKLASYYTCKQEGRNPWISADLSQLEEIHDFGGVFAEKVEA